MNWKEKFLITAGESIGIVLGYAVLYGTVWFLIKTTFIKILSTIGIDHFVERARSLQWIGQLVIETRAILKADRACFYRCSNGFSYILNDDAGNEDIKIYSLANKTRNRGVTPLPEKLNKRHLEWYLQFAEINLLKSYFTTDLPINSPLRNELAKLDIESYLVVKILSPDKHQLYGFLLLTWHNHKEMPPLPESSQKTREMLESVANNIYSEVLFLIRNPYKDYANSKFKKLIRIEKWKKKN